MSTLDRLARGSAMSLEELAAEVGDNGRRKRQRGLEEVAAEVGDKRRRIEAERVMKARQNAERMGRHDCRSRNDTKRVTRSKAMGGQEGRPKCEHCIGEHTRSAKNSRWSSIEAERMIKAKQDSDFMGGHDFRSQNAAKKGLNAGLFDAEMEA